MIPDNYDAHRERVLSALRGLITNIEKGDVVAMNLAWKDNLDISTYYDRSPASSQTITLEVYRGIKTK